MQVTLNLNTQLLDAHGRQGDAQLGADCDLGHGGVSEAEQVPHLQLSGIALSNNSIALFKFPLCTSIVPNVS